ncbi:MAG: hypothetical protein JWM11_1475 [Planctomycetaceae bacterium]|nr:hypothetical protein [Planctomycetaceae bacterium]
MDQTQSPLHVAAEQILDDLAIIILDAEQATKPLELPPFRPQLFELFARAVATGLVHEDAEPDLSSDGVLKALAERFGLASGVRNSVAKDVELAPEHLAKMRLLWSLLRMWMEWTYAWERWPEYHIPA